MKEYILKHLQKVHLDIYSLLRGLREHLLCLRPPHKKRLIAGYVPRLEETYERA